MAVPGGAYPGLDGNPVQGLGNVRADPVRQSRLNYGQVCVWLPGGPAARLHAAALTTAAVGAAYVQELRSQMEADERRKQQQRALRTPVEVPAVGAVPQPRNKLPGVRGATPPERAARAPLGPVGGRPQSGRRAELQVAQVDSRSPRQRAREAQPREAANAPPRFGGAGAEEGGSGQRVLEQEVQHLTHQVQELLVGLHGRVLLLEQDLSVKTRDNSALVDRLQGLELDNVSLRAEVKMLAPGDRVVATFEGLGRVEMVVAP